MGKIDYRKLAIALRHLKSAYDLLRPMFADDFYLVCKIRHAIEGLQDRFDRKDDKP